LKDNDNFDDDDIKEEESHLKSGWGRSCEMTASRKWNSRAQCMGHKQKSYKHYIVKSLTVIGPSSSTPNNLCDRIEVVANNQVLAAATATYYILHTTYYILHIIL
jgi:hypothetical protein